MNNARTGSLDEVNDQIADLRRQAQKKWTEFEEYRDKVVTSGKGEVAINTESKEFKHANELNKEYNAVAQELKDREAVRDTLFETMASEGRSRNEVDTKAPGSWLAVELKTISSGADIGAAITPAEYADFFFDRLAAKSVGLESGFTVIPTDKKSLVVPRVTADQTASWTTEGDAITASDPDGEPITATPRKLAALTQITREVYEDAVPAALAVTENSIIRSLALGLDFGFFEGDGTPPEIRGLKNVAGIQSVDMGTNGAVLANIDPIADAIGLLEAENAEATAIVMHPRSWKAALKLKEQTTGNNKPLLSESAATPAGRVQRSIYGVPVYLTSQLSVAETQGSSSVASSIYVYEAPQVVAVRRQGTQVDVDPFYKFAEELVGVRATCRWDLAVPNPKAVVRIKGVL